MPNIIKPKRRTSGGAPSASQLQVGEIAINLLEKKIYTKDHNNNIICIGAYKSPDADKLDGLDSSFFVKTSEAFGIAQTYQNKATQRQFNTVYFNTSQKGILVVAGGNGHSSNGYQELKVDEETVFTVPNSIGSAFPPRLIGFVPAGSSYECTSGACVGFSWTEFR